MLPSQEIIETNSGTKLWKWMLAYTHFIYKYWWVFIVTTLIFVPTFSGLIIAKKGFTIGANTNNYRWSGDDISNSWDAYVSAEKLTFTTATDKNGKITVASQQSQLIQSGIVIYEVEGGNCLDVDVIKLIWNAEQEMRATKDLDQFCYLVPNDTKYVDLIPGSACLDFMSFTTQLRRYMEDFLHKEPSVDLITQEIINDLAHNDTNRGTYFGNDFNPETNVTGHIRSILTFGFPLAGYKNKFDRTEEQGEKMGKWAYSFIEPAEKLQREAPLGLKAYPSIQYSIDMQVSDYCFKQCLWLIGSFGFLFVFSIIHMNSLFPSFFGIIGVFFSIPCAIATMSGIIGITNFDAINAVGFFLICGIGSDCVFIVFDLFRQAQESSLTSPEHQLCYAAQRGLIALATSVSTAAVAFLALCTSGVRIMNFFGLFCFVLLFFAFVFTFTWFLSIIAVWTRFKDKFRWPWEKKKAPDSISIAPLIGEDGNEAKGNTEDRIAAAKKTEGAQYPYTGLFDFMFYKPIFNFHASGLDIHGYSAWERFVHNYLAPIVYFYRLPIVVVMLFITIFLGFHCFQIKTKYQLQFLPSDKPFQRVLDLAASGFSTAMMDFSFVYVWGLKPKNTVTFKHKLTIDDYGDPNYIPIDLMPAESQLYIYDMCQLMRQQDFIDNSSVSESFSVCPIEIWKEYLESSQQPFPLDNPTTFTSQMVMFPFTLDLYMGSHEPDPYVPGTKKSNTLGFYLENSSLAYWGMKWNMKIIEDMDSTKLRPIWKKTQDFAEVIKSQAPEDIQGLNSGFTTAIAWLQMVLQEMLPKQVIYDVMYAFLFAMVTIYLSTFSVLYTVFVLYSMVSVIFIILGILSLDGWKIGTNEAIMISIASAYCTDFIVQPMLAMAHDHSKRTLFGKIQNSLTTFCSPVSSALITTLAAAVFLYPCEILLFPPFATFLIGSGLFGFMYGFIVLPALIALIGPDTCPTKCTPGKSVCGCVCEWLSFGRNKQQAL